MKKKELLLMIKSLENQLHDLKLRVKSLEVSCYDATKPEVPQDAKTTQDIQKSNFVLDRNRPS